MNDQSQMMNQHQMAQMAPQQQQMVANQAQMSYGQWPLPPLHSMTQPPPVTHSMTQPPVLMNAMKFSNPPMFKPGRSGGGGNSNNNNWKGKKVVMDNKRKDLRRKDNLNMNNSNMNMNMNMNVNSGGGVGGGSYQPPTLFELEQQNRLKARRYYHPKKKFNRMGAYAHAPRNTTSYIIRAKKSGGIASLVSPCPVTPAVLPTPVFSPSREALVDMAKEEWGVDGYGSMKGLIRLRSPGHDETVEDYDEEDEGGSSESDVEEHVVVERRLDNDLSRFEMIYPNTGGVDHHHLLENRVDDQDTHIAQLEEENLILKERLYLMERELGEMRRRLLCLERQNQVVEDINEEVVDNVSENDSQGLRSIPLLVNRDNNEEVDFVPGDGETGPTRDASNEMMLKELKDLDVKEVVENNEYGAGLEGNRCMDGMLDDGLGFVMTVANQGVGHDEQLAGKLSEKPIEEKSESVKNKGLGSADGVKFDSVADAVKGQSVGDVHMGENMPDDVNDGDRPANVVNNGIEEISKKEDETMVNKTQAEDISGTMVNEVAGDALMGDMVSADKAGDHQSDG